MRFLTLCLLLLASTTVYAATNGNGNFAQFFSLASNDQSYVFLTTIFGEVGNVLPGSEGLLGTMFKTFNEVMLVLNTIVIGYAAIFGMVNTAQEGEFLGKKFNSIWVPIRAVAGIGLLIPTASGYCMLQIIMMWIVLQGVGAADTVWQSVLTYVQKNPSAPSGSGAPSSVLETQAQNITTGLLLNLICMHTYYKSNNPNATYQSDTQTATLNTSSTTIQYTFPILGNSTNNTCGVFSYTNPQQFSGLQSMTNSQYLYLFQSQAINSMAPGMMTSLNNAAKEFVYNCDGDPSNLTSGKCSLPDNPMSTTATSLANALSTASQNYENQIGGEQLSGNLFNNINADGWAYAGAFYHQLSSAYQASTDITGTLFKAISQQAPVSSSDFSSSTMTSVKNAILQTDPEVNPQFQQLSSSSDLWQFGSNLGTPFRILTNWIVVVFVGMITGHENIIGGQVIQSGSDPIMGIQALGEHIINITEFMWFLILIAMVVVVVAGAACGAINPIFGIALLVLKLMTALFALLAALFVAGLVMSVYIPMIPYIIFLFGVLGWLLAVIETMLAAPMVAMGLTHPEGHEVYGRAEPAVMLITNVFTRPTLMIFGFVAGMLIARVGIDFLNATYDFVVLSNSGADVTSVGSSGQSPGSGVSGYFSGYGIGPIQLILYIVIYVSLAIVIVNKSFSLIHIIPDNVLRWIGNQHQFGEYAQGEQEVSGMAKSGAGQAAQSGLMDSAGINKLSNKGLKKSASGTQAGKNLAAGRGMFDSGAGGGGESGAGGGGEGGAGGGGEGGAGGGGEGGAGGGGEGGGLHAGGEAGAAGGGGEDAGGGGEGGGGAPPAPPAPPPGVG